MSEKNLLDRVIALESWTQKHDAVCAERYGWILFYIKIAVGVLGASTLAQLASFWHH